jgi:hypothetical protein
MHPLSGNDPELPPGKGGFAIGLIFGFYTLYFHPLQCFNPQKIHGEAISGLLQKIIYVL